MTNNVNLVQTQSKVGPRNEFDEKFEDKKNDFLP